jgi:branched-chain amino acid transport system permease protein
VSSILQYLASGIAAGSLYGMIALGIVLVYKSTHVFNFAHGELVALGAYLLTTFTARFHGLPWLAIGLVLVAMTVIGVLMHVLIIRHMMNKPLLTTVMVTIGIGLVIRACLLIFYGPSPIQYASFIPRDVLDVAGVRIAESDLIIAVIAFVLLGAFAIFFTRSRMGLEMRAVASQQEAAVLSGVNAGRVFAVALAIGTFLAGVAGVLLANTTVVSPSLTGLALVAFPAVVIGGSTSIPGAVVGGLIVGVLEKIVTGTIGADAAIAVVYALLLFVLLSRPEGIFGRREVVRA